MKRFKTVKEVPIIPYAMVKNTHPDIKIIIKAYEKAGAGIAIKKTVDKKV